MAKFDNAKKNNRVWSVQHGWGTVIDFSEGYVHWFFQVKFDNGYDQWYFPDGRAEKKDANPTLFWNEIKLPAEEEDKKPFDLVEFLRENLEPEEFIVGAENIAFIYNYANNTWEIGIYNFTHIETTYISKISEEDYLFNDILDVLIEKQVTPQQLKQAYKILNWL